MIIHLIMNFLDLFLAKWKINHQSLKLVGNLTKLSLTLKLKMMTKKKLDKKIFNKTKKSKSFKNKAKTLLENHRLNLKYKTKNQLKEINNKRKIQKRIRNQNKHFSSLNL